MIAELDPNLYDVHGRRVFRPGLRHRRLGFRPTAAMGRNFTQPLRHKCTSFEEMRSLLATCQGASKKKEHAKHDHWQAPDEFEETRTGNCVDYAQWAWRQLVDMGYRARVAGGKCGMYGEGHAWVTFEKDGKFFLLEPQLALLGSRMPRISTLRYHPAISVGWDGHKVSYYVHEKKGVEPRLIKIPGMAWEWLAVWVTFWAKTIPRIIAAAAYKILLGSK